MPSSVSGFSLRFYCICSIPKSYSASCLFLNFINVVLTWGVFYSVTCFIPLNILFLRCIWGDVRSQGASVFTAV